MPYRGSPPKSEADRVNRIPKKYDKTTVKDDEGEILRGIDLPATAPQGVKWCEQTKIWWEHWRRSPQAKLMGTTDWDFMLDCAVLHNDIWRPRQVRGGKLDEGLSPTAKANYMAELRQRVAKFGATWEDRAKLQIEIETPQTEEAKEKAIESAAKATVYDVERLTKKAAEVKEKQ